MTPSLGTVTAASLAAIAGVHHGFGTRAEPLPQELASYWDTRPDKRQVHGTAVARVSAAQARCGEVDGMYTDVPRCLLHIGSADCVPVLLARQDGGAIAAMHGGWRGIVGGIVAELATCLERHGERLADWVAAIGPAIGACCYEVDAALVDRFAARFPDLPAAQLAPRPRHLDLRAVMTGELLRAGITAIEVVPGCTRCSRDGDGEPVFPSFRRDGAGHVMWSTIVIDAVT